MSETSNAPTHRHIYKPSKTSSFPFALSGSLTQSLLLSLSLFFLFSHSFFLYIPHRQSAAHAAQVYQVTRSGHEHCDVTEGVLLDITPLVVDGRKLVTLYDKDLTEGVNLLIGK